MIYLAIHIFKLKKIVLQKKSRSAYYGAGSNAMLWNNCNIFRISEISEGWEDPEVMLDLLIIS